MTGSCVVYWLNSSRGGVTCRSVASSRAAPTTPLSGWVLSCRCGCPGLKGRWSLAARNSCGCRSWLRCFLWKFRFRSLKATLARAIPGSGRFTRGSMERPC